MGRRDRYAGGEDDDLKTAVFVGQSTGHILSAFVGTYIGLWVEVVVPAARDTTVVLVNGLRLLLVRIVCY